MLCYTAKAHWYTLNPTSSSSEFYTGHSFLGFLQSFPLSVHPVKSSLLLCSCESHPLLSACCSASPSPSSLPLPWLPTTLPVFTQNISSLTQTEEHAKSITTAHLSFHLVLGTIELQKCIGGPWPREKDGAVTWNRTSTLQVNDPISKFSGQGKQESRFLYDGPKKCVGQVLL